MSRILMSILAFSLLVFSHNVLAEESYELEHKNGRTVTVNDQSSFEIDLPFLEAYETKEFLCYKTIKGNPKYEFEVVEYQLELGILIQHLESQGDEAKLTRTQKIFISKIPFCNFFEKELRVITLILKGYKVVKD